MSSHRNMDNDEISEMDSEFSFMKSDYLPVTPTKNHAQQSNDQVSIVSDSTSVYSSRKSGANTPIQVNEKAGTSNKKKSERSYVSQTPEKVNAVAEHVSVKVVNPGNVKSIHHTQEQSGTIKVSAGNAGGVKKLSTIRKSSEDKMSPKYSYNTAIDGSIPPRSSRRPKSEVLHTNNELDKDIEKFHQRAKKHSKHRSLSINDDLDELMGNARLISSSQMKSSSSKPNSPLSKDDDNKSLVSNNSDTNYSRRTPNSQKLKSAIVTPKQRNASRQSLPPRPTADDIKKAREVSSQFRSENGEDLDDSFGIEEVNIKDCSDPNESAPITPVNMSKNNPIDGEGEYYDIEDDNELQYRPSKAKPVNQSTRYMKNTKPKRAKSKKVKTSTKPFSYSTLISLLESMNGTIIGEEFSQLNLPMKEKQLIEKIIDSLSRLTSDMVLDEERYEVGIVRLEKALRVLEGFM